MTSGALKKLLNPAPTHAALAKVKSWETGSPVTELIDRAAHWAGPPTASSASTSTKSSGGRPSSLEPSPTIDLASSMWARRPRTRSSSSQYSVAVRASSRSIADRWSCRSSSRGAAQYHLWSTAPSRGADITSGSMASATRASTMASTSEARRRSFRASGRGSPSSARLGLGQVRMKVVIADARRGPSASPRLASPAARSVVRRSRRRPPRRPYLAV